MRRLFARWERGARRANGDALRTHDATATPPLQAPRAAAARAGVGHWITLIVAALSVCACSSAGVTPTAALAVTDAPPPLTTAHIPTWAYDDGCNGGAGASGRLVRQWVTYAESNCGPSDIKARSDCHSGPRIDCDVLQYLDTNWEYAEGSIQLDREASYSWWLHRPAPNQSSRIYSAASGGGHLLNQSNSSVQRFFHRYIDRHYNADDGLMMDDQGASISGELYYSDCGCRATAELTSNGALVKAHTAMSTHMTHRSGMPFLQVDNALAPNPYLPQGFTLLSRSHDVRGLITEGAPESDGVFDANYSTLLDQIAYVTNRTFGFVVLLSYAPAGAPYVDQTRRVQEGTMLLGYGPGHLVDWADLERGSRALAVWPEEGLYPSHPLQSMRTPHGPGCLAGEGVLCSKGGHNTLQVAPGVYRREFASCDYRGRPFGACAAIVNTTASPITVHGSWLHEHYTHSITFAGGDVQSGGKIRLNGAPFTADATAVGPQDALLLAP